MHNKHSHAEDEKNAKAYQKLIKASKSLIENYHFKKSLSAVQKQ